MAEIIVYGTNFDIMSRYESLTGQEAWTSNDPDLGLGYGAADGIARLRAPSGASNAAFIGGFYRDDYPPGTTDVLVWPELPTLGTSLRVGVDVVLIGSTNFGPFAADDIFGWCLCDGGGAGLLRLCFEPTSSVDSRREVVVYDIDGVRHTSGLDVNIGALYRFEISLAPDIGGERALVKIVGENSQITVFDGLLPAGTLSSVDRVAASWEMPSAVIDPVTGIVSGFGSNFMVFDNLSIATTIADSVHVSDIWVLEEGGSAVVTAQLCQALATDLVIDYLTVGGNALAGSDYTTANSASLPFVIPAGALQGSVSIPLHGDEIAEADETFRLLFTPAQGAPAFTAASALVTILDDDDSDGDGLANSWELARGLDPDDPEDALLDTDGNGSSALLDFAFGVAAHGVTGLPTLAAGSGEIVFSYRRDLALTHLSYRVQTSTNLLDWTPFPDELVSTSAGIETRRAVVPVEAAPSHRYVRVSVVVVAE